MAANVIWMKPKPKWMAVTHVQDIKSPFRLSSLGTAQKSIMDHINLDGRHVVGEKWKENKQTRLQAFSGVLVLAGVFRSNWESTEILWVSQIPPDYSFILSAWFSCY